MLKYPPLNPSNPDSIGPEESVLISEVSLFQGLKSIYTHMVLGEEESVVFREVSLFQGCGFHCIYILPLKEDNLSMVDSPNVSII